jgi:NADH-ubiquinone oxidoreductase chain 5
MYNLVLLFPLLNTLLLSLSFDIGIYGTSLITIIFMSLTVLTSYYALYSISLCGQTLAVFCPLWTWFDLELFTVDFGGYFDTLSCVMLCVVTTVSLAVHVYSLEYMKNDMHLQRFLAYLSLFTFFMVVLVTSNNFIQLFMGWEGVGACSYLLINFWFTRIQANKAAIKAVIVNRIGDTAFLIAVCLIFRATGAADFDTVFSLADLLNKNDVNLICLFLFIGAMGKSAQIGLHTWLPDAMEGPTPVSALIHAATMVTAGVFLVIRCSALFQEAHLILSLMTIVGALTTFFAATTALVQTDLKRVIAYSTCSQLGYMITACGLSAYHASVFHLSNHAFFKALLFLTAGSIIHAMGNEQDMRKMGGLINLLPFSYCMILIASLALAGFPFLSGYYSKDAILEIAYAKYTIPSHFAFWLGSISAFCTSFYSIRLIFLTFLGEVNTNKQTIKGVHDAPLLMAIPMFSLSIPSIFIGYYSKDFFIGLGTPFWGNSIATSPTDYNVFLTAEFLPFYIKIIPVLFSFLGMILATIVYQYFISSFNIFNTTRAFYDVYNFLSKKWYFDKLNNEFIVQYFLSLGYGFAYKSSDRGILEIFGPTGLSNNTTKLGLQFTRFFTGLPYHYVYSIVFGFVYILFFFVALSINIPLEVCFLIFILLLF